MRGRPTRWTRCPACHRIVVAIPVAGSDPPTYRIGRHNVTEGVRYPVLCALSITTVEGAVYATPAEVSRVS